MKLRATAVATMLLCSAFDSSALTLGRIRGAALIGQPLDLVVQVQLDASEDPQAQCFEADVFHSDTRQESSRVKVTVEPAAGAGGLNVRVTSMTPVDEPMVTVYMRAGCQQKTSRRYVVLADLASDMAAPMQVPPMTVTPAAASTGPSGSGASVSLAPAIAAGPGSSSGTSAGSVSAAPGAVETAKEGAKSARGSGPVATTPKEPSTKPANVKAKSSSTVAPKAKMTVTKPSAEAVKPAAAKPEPTTAKPTPAKVPNGQPRLKLDPVESLASRVASLETSTAVAAAEEASRDALRVKSLEGDVKALLALAAKNEATLLDMRMRLEKAEAERISPWWLYGLGGLAVLSLGSVVALWRRRKAAPEPDGDAAWWSAAQKAPGVAPSAPPVTTPDIEIGLDSVLAPEPVPVPVATQASRHSSLLPSLLDSEVDSQVDVNLVDMDDSMFDKLMPGGSASKKADSQPAPLMGKDAPKVVDSDELMDVRQQAEFFVSLGQTDQAIAVLEKRIGRGNCGPLVYLDLLAIFHSRNLKTDYRELRDDFNRRFNGRVPEFAAFANEGRGIEGYPSVFGHIVGLWPSVKVLEIIETCIFRDPWDDLDQAFDLAAFRDLLFLFAIVHAIADSSDSGETRPPTHALAKSGTPRSKAGYFDTDGNAGLPSMPAALEPVAAAVVIAPAPGAKGQAVDLDLSETELGTIYAPTFTAPVPLAPNAKTGEPKEMPAIAHDETASPPAGNSSLMDFELPSEDDLASFKLKKPSV